MSTDENQVLLALQEWYQTDTFNLYASDQQGVYYSMLLENVRSTKQPEENVIIDVLEVRHKTKAVDKLCVCESERHDRQIHTCRLNYSHTLLMP